MPCSFITPFRRVWIWHCEPSHKVAYDDIPADQLSVIEDVVLNRRKGAAEDLIELAQRIKEEQDTRKAAAQGQPGAINTNAPEEEWRKGSVEERLKYALRKGVAEHLDHDLHEALQKFPHAVNIIEMPLMDGMNEVGNSLEKENVLAASGETARTMKQAVAILQPYIEAEKKEGSVKAGKLCWQP